MNSYATRRSTGQGFTLIELAFILIVLSLLLVNLLEPLSANIAKRQRERTQVVIDEIQEALLGYAALNSKLPCADKNGDGLADTGCTNTEVNSEGDIPWADLGVEREDAWGRIIRYRPYGKYTSTPIGFHNSYGLAVRTALDLDSDNEADLISNKSKSGIAAVIFSLGPNRRADLCNDRSVVPLPTTCRESNSNSNVAIYYTQDGPIQTIDGTNDFDDILVWLPRNVLFNRLVKAKKWVP